MNVGLWVAVIFIVGFFTWRSAAKFYIIPWPHWLSWMLENPYMLIVSNSKNITKNILLSPGMTFADFGCGAGRITTPAAKIVGSSGLVHAFDIQEKMITKAENRSTKAGLSNIKYFSTELKPGILAENLYDRATLVTVLGEIPKRNLVLKEIFKSIKPGGIISITEVIPDPCYITRTTLKKNCKEVGFEYSQIWKSPLAYTMNFKKPN